MRKNKFKDQWGNIWYLQNHPHHGGVLAVWNKTIGWGVWDDGKGLTEIY